jgi:predicted DNA binding protein
MNAVGLRLRPDEGAFPGVDRALARAPGVSREALSNLEWLSDGSYLLLYQLRADDGDAVEAVLADHDDVYRYEVAEPATGRFAAFVHVAERPSLSALLELVDEHALLLQRPFSFDDDGVTVTAVGDGSSLQRAFTDVGEELPVDVEWTGEFEPEHDSALARLTSRQREALATAYDLGFYETPRAASYEAIGDALGCAPSTANELLRRAEAALVAGVLE